MLPDRASEQRDWLNSMNKGQQKFQQGRFAEAIDAFSQATRLLPLRVESWVNLGAALLEAGRFESSASTLQKAIAISPDFMMSHMMLGDALRQLGLSNHSLASYRKAVSLKRTPAGLNKLACALRSRREVNEAKALYREAIGMAPAFTLAQVNLATLYVEMSRFEEASTQLNALAKLTLAPVEREEVEKSKLSLSEYYHLKEPLAVLGAENNPAPLEDALANMPTATRKVDEDALKSVRRYLEATNNLSTHPVISGIELPGDWLLIEAMFMVPMVSSVNGYLEIKAQIGNGEKPAGDLLESLNMEAAILAARKTRQDLRDPVKAELHLRHWHALACKDVPGFFPGHFKYTQNWSARSPTLKRVEPALAGSTFRHFIDDIYCSLEPGLLRAAIVWIAVCNLHPFTDGNGRVGLNWLNRELEWAGLMPALFTRELGIKGELGEANKAVRNGDGDLSPVLAVITRAQGFAVSFCNELDLCDREDQTA